MPFTDRFIKVPIQTYNTKDAELTGTKEYEDNWEKFNPLDLSAYFPSVADGNSGTHVQLKSGHSFWVDLTPEKFEQLLNKHQQ